MPRQRFQVSEPLSFPDIARLVDTLCAIPGIHGVDATPGARELAVHADLSAVSPEAIVEAAGRAGYPDFVPVAGSASCCSGCCH